MMKKFENAELEVHALEVEDIMTTSPSTDEWSGEEGDDGTAWN